MDFKNLLCLSSCGSIYWEKMNVCINNGCKYSFIKKVNKVLSSLDESQIKIIENNYKPLKDISQLLDKLCEIIVAYDYLQEEPLFFNDNSGKPDIFLKKSKRYIEVKKLNNSDNQKAICKYLLTHQMHESTSNYNTQEIKDNYNAVFKKAKQHIDKALEQLGNKNGLIYLIYSLDIIKSHISEQDFIPNIIKYYCSKETNILLYPINEKEIYPPPQIEI